jgi:hypothetical protein
MTFPPPENYPPPPSGYAVPTHLYSTDDPLVPRPVEGFSGWIGRVANLVRQHWRRLLAIAALTYGIPLAAAILLVSLAHPGFTVVRHSDGTITTDADGGSLGLLVVILVGAAVVIGYLTGAANAAVVWNVTRQAAGEPAPFGAALGYGFANGVRLWGWSLLYGLTVLAGTCACVIPGLYCALAGCLYAPIAVYERRAAISTSFRMVNRNFGAALGRMALLLVLVYGMQFVLNLPGVVATAANPAAGAVVSALGYLLGAPLPLVLTLGTVVLYAELRARREPVTAAGLNAELVR